MIERFSPTIPMLGVCLGHQCIGHTFGGEVVRADRIMHGKTSLIHHDGKGLYRGLPNPFQATRYHSLVIRPGTLPADLEVVAWTDQDEIMGVRHKRYPLEGVQYHPESFLTHRRHQAAPELHREREVKRKRAQEGGLAMLTVEEALEVIDQGSASDPGPIGLAGRGGRLRAGRGRQRRHGLAAV